MAVNAKYRYVVATANVEPLYRCSAAIAKYQKNGRFSISFYQLNNIIYF